ncbi:Arm DNA-binding domain-containing protein [Fulvimarina pelagi]
MQIRNLRATGKPPKISGGDGLHVLVSPADSELWPMAYRYGRKQKLLSFGSYPAVDYARRKRGPHRRTPSKRSMTNCWGEAGTDGEAETTSSVRMRLCNSCLCKANVVAQEAFRALPDYPSYQDALALSER